MIDKQRKIILEKLNLVEEQDSLSKKIPVVEVKGLDVNFNRASKIFEAVKNANLKIYENDILGVVGESGSGKTTLGRTMLGLVDQTSGEVRINGRKLQAKRIKSVNKKNIWVYKNGQMIFQDPTSSLNKQKKVFSLVNEGLHNFNFIKEEAQQKKEKLILEIIELKHQEKILSDPKFAKKCEEEKLETESIISIIKNSENKKFNKFVNEYTDYLLWNKNLDSFRAEKKTLKKDVFNKISFIKKKIKSDKILLKEDSQFDNGLLSTAMKDEIDGFHKLEKNHTIKPEKIEKNITERIKSFIRYVIKNGDSLNPITKDELASALVATISVDTLKKSLVTLKTWIYKNKDTQDFSSLNVVKNIIAGIETTLLKLENKISPFNTRAFDFIYKFIDTKIMDKINMLIELLKDLNSNLLLQKEILNSKLNESEKIFQKAFVTYLEEYREIIISIIDEYRILRINYKIKFKTHKTEGVKHFYKYMYKINSRNNLLQLSLITWKGKHRIDYEVLRNNKLLCNLEFTIKDIEQKVLIFRQKYPNFNNPKSIIQNILETELKKENSKISVSLEEFQKNNNDKKISIVRKAIEEKELEVKKNLDIITNKKIRKIAIKKKIQETLKLIGLSSEDINKYPNQFSGGQKQRIGIARTIITKPKFIIADEPISALDVSVQAQVINLLKDLHNSIGLTMMFIAHDLQMVHYISNKIAVIYRGNIVEYGDADKVYKTPKHPYTKSLIAAMPSLRVIGKSLKISDYKWSDHKYNEFSKVKLHEISKDHFVFGTEKEINIWKR